MGPGTSRDSGLVPLCALGARAHPGDRTEGWALAWAGGYSACGGPGRCAYWSGCVCSVASNFSPITLVSHRRASDRARGAGHQCPRGAGSRWDGQQEDEADGRGPGRTEQGQRPWSRALRAPGAWSPRAEEACPGREPPLGPENVGRGRDREGDLEEDPVSDVRSPPGSFS